MADLQIYVATIQLWFKPRTLPGELSLSVLNTFPLAGQVTAYYNPDFSNPNGVTTLEYLVNNNVALYAGSTSSSSLLETGWYSEGRFPVLPYAIPPAPGNSADYTYPNSSPTVYSYRPDLAEGIDPIYATGLWELDIIGFQPGSGGGLSTQEPIYGPAEKTCTNVGYGLFNVLWYFNDDDVNPSTLCDPTKVQAPFTSVRYPLLNGVSAFASLEDIVNLQLPLYSVSTSNPLDPFDPYSGTYISEQRYSDISDVSSLDFYRLLSNPLSSSSSWDNTEYVCPIIEAPAGDVGFFDVYFSEDGPTLQGYCGNIDSNIRVYYIIPSSGEYTSIEELAVAQEEIFVSQIDLPSNVIPEYWELTRAEYAAYGSNPYQKFIFDFTTNSPGFLWKGINPNYDLVIGSTANILDLLINIQTASFSQGIYNTFNCDSQSGLFIKSNTLYRGLDHVEIQLYFTPGSPAPSYTIFYANEVDEDLTIYEIAQRQIPIYTTSVGAEYSINSDLASGFLTDREGIYWEFNTDYLEDGAAWRARGDRKAGLEFNYPYEINVYIIPASWYGTVEVQYKVVAPEVSTLPQDLYDDANEYRIRYKDVQVFRYQKHLGLPNWTLDEIAKYGLTIYYPHPVLPSALFSITENIAIGVDNDTHYIATYGEEETVYIGVNADGDITDQNVSGPIVHEVFELPTSNAPVLADGTGNAVFYAFMSCADISGSQRIYIVYGNHTSSTPVADRGELYEFTSEIGIGSTFYTVDSEPWSPEPLIINSAKTYIHTLVATNPSSARELLVQVGYDYNDILFAEASDLGLVGVSTVLWGTLPCYELINSDPKELREFNFLEEVGVEEDVLRPRLDLEKNYKLENLSKPLLRTNPKLSSNIKLVVDSSDNIYLETISATKDLADSKYKAFSVSPSGSYSYDISRFYNDNKTPYEMTYSVKRDSSDFSALSDYAKQFEDEYQYGAKINSSKRYNESFRLFAPIWLDTNVPKLFLVYRIDGPVPSVQLTDSNEDKLSRVDLLLKNSTLIKTFDLSDNSNLGSYIRSHVNDTNFPSDCISVSFEKNEQTFYNGIDIARGGFARKGEFIYKDFVYSDKTLIESNDFITDGFRRNGLVSANLMNLEFMFDDSSAEEFTVNRYIGIYADAIPSGMGEVDNVNRGIIKFSKLESYMDSSDETFAIPDYKLFKNAPALGYVTTKQGYINIPNGAYYDTNAFDVKIANPHIQIEDLRGITDTGRSVALSTNVGDGFDFLKLTVEETPGDSDQVIITEVKKVAHRVSYINHIANENANTINFVGLESPFSQSWDSSSDVESGLEELVNSLNQNQQFSDFLEAEIDIIKNEQGEFITTCVIKEKKAGLSDILVTITNNNPSSVVKVENIYSSVNILEDTLVATSSLSAGRISGTYFSSNGTNGQIAGAIAACINNIDKFRAITNGNEVYVISKFPGYKLMNSAVLLRSDNTASFVTIEDSSIDSSNELELSDLALQAYENGVFTLRGGYRNMRSAKISIDSLGAIGVGDLIQAKGGKTYAAVLDIVDDINDLTGDYKIVIFDRNIEISEGVYKVYSNFRCEMGLFSCYDFYDMDFDFYDESNSDLKELSLETIENTAYAPAGDETLLGTELLNEDYFKDSSALFANLLPVLNQETPDSQEATMIKSEFDRLNENFVNELTTNSRVVPSINKFVLEGAKTVRNNPYYLNVNEAFGRTNFAPDLEVRERDPKGFSHEWFYISDLPDYFTYLNVNKSFSYVNFIGDTKLEKNLFMSTEHDYFNIYLVGEGYNLNSVGELEEDFDDFKLFAKTQLDKKYSIFKKGSDSAFASTFFNGIKVVLKHRKESINEIPTEFIQDSSANGYRFSTVVKFNTNAESNTIRYDVIKNDVFKFVILFIEVDLNERYVDGKINRRLLYTLTNKLAIDGDSFGYDDIEISGALIFSGINFNAPGPYEIPAVTHVNGSVPSLDLQLAVLNDNLYGDIEIDYGFEDEDGNPIPYYVTVKNIKTFDTLVIDGAPKTADGVALDPTYIPYSTQLSAKYTYKQGGKNAHSNFLKALSAGRVADLINNKSPLINYTTIDKNGNQIESGFVIAFEDGKEIVKESSIISVQDTNKPSTYSLFNGTIGYNISERNPYYPFLIRHSGNYTVSMNPVLTFTDVYNHHKIERNYLNQLALLFENDLKNRLYKHSISDQAEIDRAIAYYKKYNRAGIAFNVGFISGEHDLNWAIIKNHFYHKVNEDNPTGVTKLSESSEFLPVYPLIGEIAIDKKDVNVLRSSWENDYYVRSAAGGDSTSVPGTLSTKETRSYLSSTIMKLSDSYSIFDFEYQTAGDQGELESILRNRNNESPVVFLETEDRIMIDFYVSDSIVDKFSKTGVLNEISKYVLPEFSENDKTTIEDDVERYVNNNLISVFSIDDIELFVSKRKNQASSIESVDSIDLIDNGGFIKDDEFSITKHANSAINFRLIYNKSLGYSYIIRPLIKIKK